MFKVVIAHPEQQHSLKTAEALYPRGLLGGYLTTVYLSEGSLTKGVSRVLPARYKAKAAGRKSELIPDGLVTQYCEPQALLKLFCQNVSLFHGFYNRMRYRNADCFAAKAARYAIDTGADIVIGYDNTSPLLYEILEKEAPDIVRVQDMTALNTFYMKPIYEKDFTLKPCFAEMLKNEQSRVWDEGQLERKRRELSSAQYFLCASNVTRESLLFSGVEDNRCLLLPYGIDADTFACNSHREIEKPVRFVYVGGTKELKGVAYLLDAFMDIDPNFARLTVVGANTLSPNLLCRYSDTIDFVGNMPHSRLPELLGNMDVMVFPSLGDGFGFAALEGMSCGLPLICTDKSGVSDLIQNGVNGYVIPAQDEYAIVDKVLAFVNDQQLITVMGSEARKTAEAFTWERYGDSLYRLLVGLVEGTTSHE